jgi:hypothetical protein
MRFVRRDVRDLIARQKNDHGVSYWRHRVLRRRSCLKSFSRDFRCPPIFDFCNRIGPRGDTASSPAVPKLVYHRLLILHNPENAVQNVRSFCSLGIGAAVNRDDSLYAAQILGIAACTRLRHRWCIRCHWCFRELGAADRMGGRCRDCRAVVRRAGLAMAAFAGAGPRGDTGRRGTSILAACGWSDCCLRHASAEDWTALRRHPRGQRLARSA